MNIYPDPFLLVVHAIFFGIVYWAFRNLVFPPVLGIILTRKKKVEEAGRELKRLEAEGLEMHEQYQNELRDARIKAQDIHKRERTQASEQERVILESAQQDAMATLLKSQEENATLRQSLLTDLDEETGKLAQHVVDTLLSKSH